MKSLCAMYGVFRLSVLAGSLFLLTAASGCATTQIYHLNMDVTLAQAHFAALTRTAEEMGYQVARLATAVNVRYDHETWIYYSMRDYDYNMAIVVDNDADQISARLEGAKAKGEEIWARATAFRQQTLRSTQPVAPSPTTPPPPAS
jgi:hypothetical protein